MARRALGSVLGSRGSWVSVMGPRRRRQICGTHVARVVGGGGGIAADSRSQQCFAGHANSLAKPPSSHGRVHSSTRRRACEWELASRFSGVGLAAAVSRRPGRRHWLVAMSRRCPHRLRSKGRLVRRGGGGERARSDAALEDRIGAFDGARRGCSFWRVHGRQRISCLSGGTDPSQRTFRGHRGARRDLVGSPRPPAGLQMFLFMDVRGHLQGQHIWICRAFGAARMRRHAWLASVWYRVQCVGRSVVLCVCVCVSVPFGSSGLYILCLWLGLLAAPCAVWLQRPTCLALVTLAVTSALVSMWRQTGWHRHAGLISASVPRCCFCHACLCVVPLISGRWAAVGCAALGV